ncbi:hypothetical protein, partial [Phocaeicola plebeius]|uniref:hypothetical protein n=1 Tax=Phocaeicola plebeius TaxID=310297 RepID=UPI0026F0AD80
CASGRVGSRRFNRSPEAETLQDFFCLYACVRFRGRPLLLFAAGFFLSFLFPLAFLCFLTLTRAAFRNAPGDVFSTKESHFSPEAPDALKTYEI